MVCPITQGDHKYRDVEKYIHRRGRCTGNDPIPYTPFTRYNRLPKRLNNRFDNRLNRVNGLLERDVVKRICFSFWICSLVFKLHEFKVAPSLNCGAKFADFCPSNVRIQIGPPSDLRYKTIPHSDILTKVPLGGVLRPRRLEREK